MEPDKIAHLSPEEKKTLFMNVTITHPQLKVVHDKIRRAIRQPAGFSFVLVRPHHKSLHVVGESKLAHDKRPNGLQFP